jgi:hypothetical protein
MMRKKSYLLSLAALLAVQAVLAQDKIYKRNGDLIEAKIKEVGVRNITFKRYDNQAGPDFVISKSEVRRIVFENGSEDLIGRNEDHHSFRTREDIKEEEHTREAYGKNIISLAPIQFTNTSVTGVGLHYERQIDKRGFLSFYLPLAFSFRNEEYYDGYTSSYDHRSYQMFWMYPGVKFYPAGSLHRVTYSVGPSVAIGMGREPVSRSEYDPVTGYYRNINTTEGAFRMGLVINNGLNIQPTPKFYIGLELGLGIPYLHTTDSDHTYGMDIDDEPVVQFNFKLGYRF